MRRNRAETAGVMILLLACGLVALIPSAWGQEQPSYRKDAEQAREEAKKLEEGLKTKPDDLTARERLIRYYFSLQIRSRSDEVEEKRQQHVFWLIEHSPASDLAGSPEAQIDPTGFSGNPEGYVRAKQLWLQQVEKYPSDAKVLLHAASFFSLWDRKIGRELLEKATLLNPTDSRTASMLAQSYRHERMRVSSDEEKAALSRKAFSIWERAVESAKGEERFYMLDDVATDALEAGETAKAEQFATELLQSAEKFKRDWNYGNAIHKGNIVLGRIALQRGDLAGARQHLLAAGETPGSPQLDSFGPNMTLAEELLEKGERDVVITYLESCGKFWKMHEGRLKDWIATVRAGGKPDFGANLLY